MRERPANRSAVDALHDCLGQPTRAQRAHADLTTLRLEVLERSPDIMSPAFRQRLSIQRNVAQGVPGHTSTDATRNMRPFLNSDVWMTAMYVGLSSGLVNGTAEPLDRVVVRALAAAGLAAARLRTRPPRPRHKRTPRYRGHPRSRPGGKPPVATRPQRSIVIRMRHLPCRRMAFRYSSQSGWSPEMQRKYSPSGSSASGRSSTSAVPSTWTHAPFQSFDSTHADT